MLGQRIPLFTQGNILTHEMLETMKEYAVGLGELSYTGYSDGILRGCQVTTTNDLIILNPGMLLHSNNIYFVTEPISVRYRPTNEWLILKVSFLGEEKTPNFITREIEVNLSKESELMEDEIEICRFKLQQGAKLRMHHRDFADLATEYDTVHDIYAKWSGYGKSSISPKVLVRFFNEVVQLPLTEPIDLLFCQQLSNCKGEAMNRNTIVLYICQKLGRPFKEYTNKEIYDELQESLKRLKGGKVENKSQMQRERRIIVD